MKLLILIIGESFRVSNNQRNTRKCGLESDPQLICSKSHIDNVIKPFMEHFDVEVQLHTYDTQFTQLLLRTYQASCPTTLFLYDKTTENQFTLIAKALSHITEEDYTFLVRFDLKMKRNMFFDICRTTFNYDNIGFPFYRSNILGCQVNPCLTKSRNPKITDNLFWIPKPLLDVFIKAITHKEFYSHHLLDLIPNTQISPIYRNVFSESNVKYQNNPVFDMPMRFEKSNRSYFDISNSFCGVLQGKTFWLKNVTYDNFIFSNTLRRKKSCIFIYKNDDGIHSLHGYDFSGYDTHNVRVECITDAMLLMRG
jgi:hypothetical protein